MACHVLLRTELVAPVQRLPLRAREQEGESDLALAAKNGRRTKWRRSEGAPSPLVLVTTGMMLLLVVVVVAVVVVAVVAAVVAAVALAAVVLAAVSSLGSLVHNATPTMFCSGAPSLQVVPVSHPFVAQLSRLQSRL